MLTRRRALAGLAGSAVLAATPLVPYVYPATAALRREDAAVLIRAYRLLHPGLGRYLTPAGRDAAEARLLAEAGAAETPAALWLAATRFTAAVRCGHSFANPFNQGKALTAGLVQRADRLPFLFRWLGERMIVTRGLGDVAGLRPGVEVLAIDGEPAARLLARLMPLARADGHNDAKRVADLEVRAAGRYEDFDILRSMTAPPGRMRVLLDVRDGGKRRCIEAPLLGHDSRPRVYNRGDGALFTAAMNDGAMVLTMPDWATYNSEWDWRSFIERTVDDAIAADARAIVVDLRGNEGGEDCGDVLFARLVDRPLERPAEARRVRFRTTPADLDPHLDTWDDSFRRLGIDAVDDGDGLLTLPPEPSLTVAPKGARFGGKLIVLVDAQCSSATFQFAQKVRLARRGPIVGEPTGGNRRGINGGAFFFVRLPHSRLEVDLPLIGSFPRVAQPDAGLIPDVIAAPTPASIATEKDPAMTAALRLA